MDDSYFASVIGHKAVKEQMKRLLREGRLPHAMIFAGQAGLGKARLALAVAETLIGRSLLPGFSKLACDTDHLLWQDKDDVYYLDVIGSMLRTGQFRALQEQLMLQAAGSRVCIINHVETMNREFANRMLKTLEEPPRGVHFILVTSQPDLLLPTIISRCVMIPFEPVSDEEMMEGLLHLRGGQAEEYRQAVQMGGGNVRRVLDLLEGRGREAAGQALEFLQIMSRHACPYTKWQSAAAAWGDSESREILRWIQLLLRDMAVLRSGVPAVQLHIGPYARKLQELLPFWPDCSIFLLVRVLDEADEAILRHVNVRLIWDYVCIHFIRAKGVI